MLNFIKEITKPKNKKTLSNKEIADFLKVNPEYLEEFEKAYQIASLNSDDDSFFKKNSRQAFIESRSNNIDEYYEEIVNKVVKELLDISKIYEYKRENDLEYITEYLPAPNNLITKEEVMALPEHLRPELTGSMVKMDIGKGSSEQIVFMLKKYLETNDIKYYHMFRQGLDILDLDPITYQILSMNRNSIGNWLPALVEANKNKDFFKIPSTKILKVPIPVLQLTRLEYMDLTRTTKEIINRYIYKVFNLNDENDYFIKTGTYSSKFDFRNAKVTKGNEVHDLGEYLLFIHYQALLMASPLNGKSIYGVSTTNEWVVREWIEDKENNPTIYHGLPLHTEFRVFVDCDSKEVLSIENYWKPEVMKKRFSENRGDGIDDKHDSVTFLLNKERLCKRYEDNKEKVIEEIKKILPDLNLKGQWSIDVMLNGDDFWLIDMAIAENSFYYDSIPIEKRIKSEENWIPKLED